MTSDNKDDSLPEDFNQPFEVLTWVYCDKSKEASEIDQEYGFDTEQEAKAHYDKILVTNGGKMLMHYDSALPEASGDVIEEYWTQ